MSLRTRRVQPMMRQLEEFSARMDEIQRRVQELRHDPLRKDECANLRRELRDLLLLTQESPRSLRQRCETFALSLKLTSRLNASSQAAICG